MPHVSLNRFLSHTPEIDQRDLTGPLAIKNIRRLHVPWAEVEYTEDEAAINEKPPVLHDQVDDSNKTPTVRRNLRNDLH